MKLKTNLLLVYFLSTHFLSSAQCITAPAYPSCTGTETLVAGNDVVNATDTKYFYGTAASLSDVKLRGGTLVVCSDLTLNNFVLDSGKIFIQPGASLLVTNGGGLVLRGNTAMYNSGTFQSYGNIVMDGTYATASKPNVIVSSSWFRMPNQYFVINNPYSWFVNSGTADFHGIITDPQAANGSVCLGPGSKTNMMVLYNKTKNSYVAPYGPACVTVSQYSQFYDTLTADASINVCLGSSHSSDASCTPWGCRPNAWGAAQVMNNCSSCTAMLSTLPVNFRNVAAMAFADHNEVTWQMDASSAAAVFYVQKSYNGKNFTTISSIQAGTAREYSVKDFSFQHNDVYYRVLYKTTNEQQITSNIFEVKRSVANNEIFPNPFKQQLTIQMPGQLKALPKIQITDAVGRNISAYKTVIEHDSISLLFESLPTGFYFIELTVENRKRVYKMIRN